MNFMVDTNQKPATDTQNERESDTNITLKKSSNHKGRN